MKKRGWFIKRLAEQSTQNLKREVQNETAHLPPLS